MNTRIGINILTKTAREQELLTQKRESRAYYEDAYNGSLRPYAEKIIVKLTDELFDIIAETTILENGNVMNVIIFEFYNLKPIKKDALRKELKKYIDGHFKRLFN
tara:strand:- start:235 stop:549 length:315 start_codon:yes stop_codon:yes gene_type:complete